jgi:hypothetical protein
MNTLGIYLAYHRHFSYYLLLLLVITSFLFLYQQYLENVLNLVYILFQVDHNLRFLKRIMIMNMIGVYVHNSAQLYTLWIVDGLRKIAITNSTFYLSRIT